MFPRETMKFAGNGRINRHNLDWLYGKKNDRPDDECWELEAFLINTMRGCGWDMRGMRDVFCFSKEFGIHKHHWRKWFIAHNPEDEHWVVVDKQMGETVWTYYKSNRQMGPLVSLDEDCPITIFYL